MARWLQFWPMRSRLAALPIAGLILAAVALAGCGSSSPGGNGVAAKTPQQILATAKAAAAAAASVHVAGSIVSEGKPISLDMELLGRSGGKGRLTLGGLGIELIDVDRSVYVKGSPAFYTHFAGPAAARLLRGKWLKGSAKEGPLASLAQLADLGKLIDITLDDHGTLSRGATTNLGGQKAVGVSDMSNDGTLYVAATGTPYPLEIAKPGAGRIVFDRWNKPVTLTVPTNAINIKQLHSGG
jgi:hypothetical protein